jgi:HPt (histidine-containing phosphotransfer) domain-containing protein
MLCTTQACGRDTAHCDALQTICDGWLACVVVASLSTGSGHRHHLSKTMQTDDLWASPARLAAQISASSGSGLISLAPDQMQPVIPASPANLVDWTMLDRLLRASREHPAVTLAFVLDLFSNALSAQISEIGAVIAADDRPQLRMLAHRLRGGSQQLGAAHLARCWAALESAALNPEIALMDLTELFEQARSSYAATLELLIARVEGDAGGEGDESGSS